MTGTIHKLTAGSGYNYLTRQVAKLDATGKGHTGLATYYTEKGESPGVWVGSGMAGIDGLAAGDIVTADQMQSLFGSGHHPLAAQRAKELDRRIGRPGVDSPTAADHKAATRLGTPFKVYENDVSAFRVEVAKRIAAVNEATGVPRDWAVPAAERASIRTEVAREFFRAEHGREPADARELAATIARHSRPKTTAVAGYDLTFSPVKSVSTLWAVADPRTAARIERAHQAAVKDALDFVERKALFTRLGTNGVRQVDVRGLVATAFTHRDSRAGDPDLHTHVAVANKVQTLDGKWRAIDGRVLFKATVAASETYNSALERHLSDGLGVRFEERPNPDVRKRPIREIVGVDPDLNRRFSKRRLSVEERRKVLVAEFQRSHGRPPTPVETLQLAQQATLETRDAKHEPRTLAEQRKAWNAEATEVLGSPWRLQRMIHHALNPATGVPAPVDSSWLAAAADRVIAAMQGSRAAWQFWHVYAEAQRQVRATDVPTVQVDAVVTELVDEVLHNRSVSLARPSEQISEPAALRRADGSSVYTVAGADLFTSAAVLAAEQRLVAAAGRQDGFTVDPTCVDMALLETTANGRNLNAGQALLVRQMATSGRRVQLAIAPAGSGKTTAMRALARAWSDGGGSVVGLAPSAAAAAALRSQIDTQTDTLAKLTHSLSTGDVPDWVAQIGPSTLVVIDEAGMADTLSLVTAVGYVLDRGGSVRLVGDDQQLAAIGAGGVLRDIRATHGAVQLSELVRFTDPAEGAATLALREGRPEAIGFYLDRGRVHVGDLATMTEEVFAAWQADRAAGLDSIMLAPTRDLVGDLNRRARAYRLDAAGDIDAGATVRLADGNQASVGDLIITRTNDRKLRISATDWVKNGDRWTVLAVGDNGDLTVRHTQHNRTVRLPQNYVEASTDLGYACTVHTAQGVTADTMHGLAAGQESRQQLYTMLTRGARGNHVYLEVVGDGDPHSVIHPSVVRPLTPTDLLETILARDDAQRSATSVRREQADPATRLGEATQRYLDSLYVAAEDVVGTRVVEALEEVVDTLVPGLSEAAAWPTLRAHLLLLGACGTDPVAALRDAAADRELFTADDPAAVLDWRLDASGHRNSGVGPLPWLPGIPASLSNHPQWGGYLTQRAQLVDDLTEQVRTQAAETERLPGWAHNAARPDPVTLADVEVWRAAMQVGPDDRRPTGGPQMQKAAATWQRRLNRRLAGDNLPALKEWGAFLRTLAPQIRGDEFTPLLAERLTAMSRAGVQARDLAAAAAAAPLPDDHAAAALWWRMARHLTPAVAEQLDRDSIATTVWTPRLVELFGAERARHLQSSSWWPALVANIDHGLQRGWRLEDLLSTSVTATGDDVDECQALVWRTSIALDPIPDEHDYDYGYDEPTPDMLQGVEPPVDAIVDVHTVDPLGLGEEQHVVGDLAVAALIRANPVPLEPSEADVQRLYERAEQWEHSPVSRERMLEVNALTQRFFEDHLADSWGHAHLTERFGVDLSGHEHFRPGHPPDGWANLVNHLRRRGITDEEMLATGVASRARSGRLIDRFRGRLVFPVIAPGSHGAEILGFVGRRHPNLADADYRAPKYLNTADTPLFHKGAQLFGFVDELLAAGAIPVLVEGPMDAIAVTLAGAGRYVGVAPLGTSLTDEQANQLAELCRRAAAGDPVVATDADLAGRVAAERDFWLLAQHGLDPGYAQLPAGADPADLLTQYGPAGLAAALLDPQPLGNELLAERLDNLPPDHARTAAIKVVAARPSHAWDDGLDQITTRLQLPLLDARRDLRDAIRAWDADPRKAAQAQAVDLREVRDRLQAAAEKPPAERWAGLAAELDPRLVNETDWPTTAQVLQEAHAQGHDIAAASRALVDEAPLGDQPARDLRYRLVAQLDLDIETEEPPPPIATRPAERQDKPLQPSQRRSTPHR